MNTVIIIGRTTTDIELKTTTSGKSVTQFTLAVPKNFKKDETNFIPVVFWGQQAEALSKCVKKGQQIAIQGELTSRKYEVDGNKRTAYEVVGSNFRFCGEKNNSGTDNTAKEEDASQGEFANYETIGEDEDLPF
jgi:single-strand DNA-binding protein